MNIVTRIRSYVRLFASAFDEGDDKAFWVADQGAGALIDSVSGRLLAFVSDDNSGNYYPALYLSPLDALRVSRRRPTVITWLATFPRVRLDLPPLKAPSLREAQDAIMTLL